MIRTRRTIYLTFLAFALEPVPVGVWFALIPEVMAGIGLSKAELAVALLGMQLGVLGVLQLMGRLLHRFGPRRILAVAYPAHIAVVCLPLLAWSQISLFAALFVYGGLIGLFIASLNVYAGRLEKERGVTIMNRAHGFWAVGVMLGSFLATLFGDAAPLAIALAVTVPVGALGCWAAMTLEKLAGDGAPGASGARRRLRAVPLVLVPISIGTLAASMTEGAMADWAAVYLAERLTGEAAQAGIGVTIYAGFLALGRFCGDAAHGWLGRVGLARAALALAVLGLACLVLPLPLWLAYPGFALVGLGVSVGFPLGISAVAALDDRHEGANIAILTSVTTLGFLVGPPMIGFLAEAYSLRVGLAALLPVLIAGLVCAGALKARAAGDSGHFGAESGADSA